MFQSHRLAFGSTLCTPSEWKPEAVTLNLLVAWPHETGPNPTINSFGHPFYVTLKAKTVLNANSFSSKKLVLKKMSFC